MKTKPDNMCSELNNVWQNIGADILAAAEEFGGKTSIPRSEVADVVLDHMRNGHDVSAETIAYLDAIPSLDDALKAVESCFQYETYGW